MGIHRSKESGLMVAQCDQCLDLVEFEDLDDPGENQYSDAKERIDMDGWETTRVGKGWRNICPDCR